VLFGNQPFTTDLIMSNRKWFRYCWVWNKRLAGGFLNAKRIPLKVTEDIAVFYEFPPTYNPQMVQRGFPRDKSGASGKGDGSDTMGAFGPRTSFNNTYYPTTLLEFSNGNRNRDQVGYHPTQKPVPLLAYLIRTYTNEGETVLDSCAGAGSTLVACVETSRNGIGIELREDYYDIACRRVRQKETDVNQG